MSNQEHIEWIEETIRRDKLHLALERIIAVLVLISIAFTAYCLHGLRELNETQTIFVKDSMDQIMQVRQELEACETVPEYMGTYTITHYCACSICCGEYADGITATGTIAEAGRTIAADPNVLPYGTEVLICGQRYTVEDCGGAVTGKHIDIFCDSHKEACDKGTYKADVYKL